MRTVLVSNFTRELALSGANGASSAIDDLDLPQGKMSRGVIDNDRRQTVHQSSEDKRFCAHQVEYAQTVFLQPIKPTGVSSFRAAVTKLPSQEILLSSPDLLLAREEVDDPKAEYAVSTTTHKVVISLPLSDWSLMAAMPDASLECLVRSEMKSAFDDFNRDVDDMQIENIKMMSGSEKT